MADNIQDSSIRSVTITIKGKEYTLRELDYDCLASFETFIRSQRLKIVSEAMAGADSEERSAARMDVLRTPIEGSEIDKEMMTFNGARYIIWLAMQDNPGVTQAAVNKLVDLDNFSEILDAVTALGVSEDSPPAPAAEASPGA